ncbi:MAG: glycosyltransferase family 2 protein [Acidobacteriia bacterium]|nr:glycosyltransferase family 2 protein [Terriglobia bacterium]
MKLTVISPTYNEAANVARFVQETSVALAAIDYEILIVDDNSPDHTWLVAEEIARRDPRVRVLRRMENPGLGPSIIDGVAAAKGEIVACMDADLQHDPGILPTMLENLLRGSAVVVGSRYVDGGDTTEWNWIRRLESWIATKTAQVCLGVKLKDPMSGYFVMRRQDVLAVKSQLQTKGFKILLEIIACLRPEVVTEIPYTFRPRIAGTSKMSSKVVVQYLLQILRLSPIGRRLSGRFVKFAVVGGSGVVVNLVVLATLVKVLRSGDWRLSAASSLVAATSNYILNNMWTFADAVRKGRRFVVGYFTYLIVTGVGLAVATVSYASMTWAFKRIALSPGELTPSTMALMLFQLIGIALGTFANYELNRSVTWPTAVKQEVQQLQLVPATPSAAIDQIRTEQPEASR